MTPCARVSRCCTTTTLHRCGRLEERSRVGKNRLIIDVGIQVI